MLVANPWEKPTCLSRCWCLYVHTRARALAQYMSSYSLSSHAHARIITWFSSRVPLSHTTGRYEVFVCVMCGVGIDVHMPDIQRRRILLNSDIINDMSHTVHMLKSATKSLEHSRCNPPPPPSRLASLLQLSIAANLQPTVVDTNLLPTLLKRP